MRGINEPQLITTHIIATFGKQYNYFKQRFSLFSNFHETQATTSLTRLYASLDLATQRHHFATTQIILVKTTLKAILATPSHSTHTI